MVEQETLNYKKLRKHDIMSKEKINWIKSIFENYWQHSSNIVTLFCFNSAAELLEQLKDEGFRQLTYIPEDGELFEGKTFFVDPNCSDTLVFSVDCSLLLQEHDLVTEGFLVRQVGVMQNMWDFQIYCSLSEVFCILLSVST